MTKRTTPAAQISLLMTEYLSEEEEEEEEVSSEEEQISGAQKAHVPCVSQTYPLRVEEVEAPEKSVEPPKSVNFTTPEEVRRILSGLRSLF
jgi:hypothetical protein